MSSRYRNEEPCENTCPKIDKIIDAFKEVDFRDDSWYDLKEVTELMELIRDANSKLREWGRELCQVRDDLQEELDDKENKISDLQCRIDELERDNSDLQKEIESLEMQLDYE